MRTRLSFAVFGLAVGVLVNAALAFAWTGPGASPPGSNVSAPVNVGTTAQAKNGDLGVNNFTAFGNVLISGLGTNLTASPFGRYLNFDYTSGGTSGTGISGYGIRDNNGTLEFKNLGGSWASLQSTISGLVGSGQWTTSATNIYNANAGNVGIGAAPGAYKLDVTGQINANSVSGSGGYVSSGNYGGTGSAAYFPQGIWSNGASSWIYGTVYVNGNIVDTTAGVIRDSHGGWVRTYGNTGWYNGTYGAGWYMTEPTWIRAYPEDAAHHVWMAGGYDSGSPAAAGCGGGLGGGYMFRVCGSAAATAFLYSSDRRLKDNIQPIDNALWKVLQITGVTFNWNSGDRKGQHDIGVIAQDVQKVVPEAVQTNPQTGYLSVDYPRLVPILVNAIKEQQTEIDSLKDEVQNLKDAMAGQNK